MTGWREKFIMENNIKYNVQFVQLCDMLSLGEIKREPKTITGGLMNRMYSIETTKGKFAVKALNPSVMARPEAVKNYIISEHVANVAYKYVPALPAKMFNGNSLIYLEKQYYLIFDWIDGITLKNYETSIEHCKIMGSILAKIHNIDFSNLGLVNEFTGDDTLIDWNYYLTRGKESKATWTKVLTNNIDLLYTWHEKVIKASKIIDLSAVISHGDLEPKNVIWHMNGPIIIDWEAAGYINPQFDLLETAVYWSMNKTGNLNKDRLLSFLEGYKKEGKCFNIDWNIVLDKGFQGKLWWLEYSLKRSLWIDCTDTKEHQMGSEHVIATIEELNNYANIVPTILSWLENKS